MNEIGPIQVLIVGFGEEARLEGRVVQELERLEGANTIRVLDLLFVRKDPESGDLLAVNVEGSELGAVAGALFGFESDGDRRGTASLPSNGTYGLSQGDFDSLAQTLEPGLAVGVLLIEHVWARGLKRAIREAGGIPMAEGFLTMEMLAAIADDLAAMSAEIEKEQAATAA